MDEWRITTNTVISLLAAGLAGMCVFFVRRYIDKFERLDSEAVRKRELKELEERIEDGRARMHDDNQRRLDQIQMSVTGTNRRLDEIMIEIMSRPGGGSHNAPR